jgi:hypothetical protein
MPSPVALAVLFVLLEPKVAARAELLLPVTVALLLLLPVPSLPALALLKSPVTVAVLLLLPNSPAEAELPVPFTVAWLSSPAASAEAWLPLAVALLLLPLATIAWAKSPVALALVPVLPSGVEATAVPLCLTSTPFRETATFRTAVVLAAVGAAEFVDVDVSEFDGLADASAGVEISPTPMPSATASAPMRPM